MGLAERASKTVALRIALEVGQDDSIQCCINGAWPCARGCVFTSSDPTDGECPSACWGQGVPDSHLQS